jgi:hypothetical protein
LLGFVQSTCTWKDGRLTAAYRRPFGLLSKMLIAPEKKTPAEQARTGISGNWPRIVDAYRTLCIAPAPAVRAFCQGIGEYPFDLDCF